MTKKAVSERPIARSIPPAPPYYRASMTPERAAVAFFRHDHLTNEHVDRVESGQIWDAVPIVVNGGLAGAKAIVHYFIENGRRFHCSEAELAGEIALGLCAQRDPRVIDLLESRIELHPTTMAHALAHAGSIALDALMRLLDHDNGDVVLSAAYAIERLGDDARAAFPKLLRLWLRRPIPFREDGQLKFIVEEVVETVDKPERFVTDSPLESSPENETSPREAATSHGPRATTT